MAGDRVLGAAIWKAVADIDFGPHRLCPHWACAIIKTQGSCPEKMIKNGVSKFLNPQDISKVPAKLALKAEEIMIRFREEAKTSPLSLTRTLNQLDTLLVRTLMNKTTLFKDVFDVANHYAALLKEDFNIDLGDPWAAETKVASALPDDAPVMGDCIQYDEKGLAMSAVKQDMKLKGFSIGTSVMEHTTSSKAKIIDIVADGSVTFTFVKRGKDLLTKSLPVNAFF